MQTDISGPQSQIKIFVTHYSALTQRKQDILNTFKKHGITNYEFIEEYDKDNLTDTELAIFDTSVIKRSMISLSLKHFKAFKEVAEKYDEALIFEDDVILSENFMEKLTKYRQALPKDYDMLFIGDGCQLHIPESMLIPNVNIYKKSDGRSRCTDSYIISKRYATIITNYLTNLPHKVNLNIGHWMNMMACDNKFQVYWAEPTIVTQGSQNGIYRQSW